MFARDDRGDEHVSFFAVCRPRGLLHHSWQTQYPADDSQSVQQERTAAQAAQAAQRSLALA